MTAFGIVAGGGNNPNHITRIDKRTGDYAIAHQAGLASAVNTGPPLNAMARLRDLLSFLDKGKPIFLRGDVLVAVNDIFGLALRTIPDVSPVLADGQLSLKLTQLNRLNAGDKTKLRNYYGSVRAQAAGLTPADAVARIVRLFIGRQTADVLPVLEAVHASNGNTTRVTTDSLPGLMRICADFPDLRFPGFTRWGPGDAADALTNYRNHFFKHVCDDSGQFPDEAVWWWKALRIIVRDTDLVPAPNLAERAYFKADTTLDGARLRDFIVNVLPQRPALKGALFAAFGQAYTDYAFRLSREMESIIVESDGTDRVLISGFGGHVIVFGRHDDVAGPLGLSSCYFVVPNQRAVKLDPNKTTRIFSMHR